MYKDKEEQKKANREAAKRYRHTREKSVIPTPKTPVIPKKSSHPKTVDRKTFGFGTKNIPGPAWLEDGN